GLANFAAIAQPGAIDGRVRLDLRLGWITCPRRAAKSLRAIAKTAARWRLSPCFLCLRDTDKGGRQVKRSLL
ncbi:hypothetical protein, partial [Ensifer sp. Root1252]|uniref:hypothetical protein n=1 Tax=Ensifer sp. Root1252 TaxID=1736438 RepID=UPI001AECE2E3